MNSTTITIGLVVVALAVGGWILLRGGKEEEEELEEAVAAPAPAPAAVAQPRPPAPAAVPAMPPTPATTYPPAAMPPAAAPMSSVPYGGGFSVNTSLTSEAHAYEVRNRWQELQL